MPTKKDANKKLSDLLVLRRDLRERFEAEERELNSKIGKITSWVEKNCQTKNDEAVEVSEVVQSELPYVSFLLSEQNMKEAAKAFVALRNSHELIDREAKEKSDELKELKSIIGNRMLDELNKSGSNSQNFTGIGTVYRSKKTRASSTDWPKFVEWAAKNGCSEMIEARVKAKSIESWQAEEGSLPPFVNITSYYDVTVRKG